VILKKVSPPAESTTAPVTTETPTPTPVENTLPSEMHYHGSLFAPEDIVPLRTLFERKKEQDGKIPFIELFKFLKTYWRWLGEQHLRGKDISVINTNFHHQIQTHSFL
jgi:hypothetical protein